MRDILIDEYPGEGGGTTEGPEVAEARALLKRVYEDFSEEEIEEVLRRPQDLLDGTSIFRLLERGTPETKQRVMKWLAELEASDK